MPKHARFPVCLMLCVSLLHAAAGVGLAGERDHEDGVFMRFSLGAGMASTESKLSLERGDGSRSETWKMDGVSIDVNFAFGGWVRPNLALHGTGFGWQIIEPDLTIGSQSGKLQAELTVFGVGAGATYYFMPANVYVSGSVGFGQLTMETDDVSADSDYGVLFDATVGKEWWVSDEWGLGVAVGLGYHSIPDPSAEENWTGLSYAIRFTATNN